MLWCGPEAATARPDTDAEHLEALTSPYRNARRRARERFAQVSSQEQLRELLTAADARQRRAAARILAERPSLAPVQITADLLAREPDVAVGRDLLDAWISGWADREPGQAPVTPALDSPLLRQRLRTTQLQVVFERLMNEGSVPGFYDGQFAPVWPLDGHMAEHLLALAHDEAFHFVARAMAIMALHESGRESLQEDLQELLLRPERQFEVHRVMTRGIRPSTANLAEFRRAEISRYALFSLAKAGFTGPLMAYIGRMEQELFVFQYKLEGGGIPGADPAADFEREWYRGLLFEVGYYYQQFDDYDNAARRYRQIVERYPESDSCQNAWYNLACIESIRDHRDEALHALEQAVRHGFNDHEWLREDGDLDHVRNHPRFEEIVRMARTGELEAGGTGATWLAKIRPYLRPGQTLFELSAEDQVTVLRRAPRLSDPEIESLLASAPGGQRDRLRTILTDR